MRFVVGTALDNLTVFHEHTKVGIANRKEPVDNHDEGASPRSSIHDIRNQLPSAGIDGRSSLV